MSPAETSATNKMIQTKREHTHKNIAIIVYHDYIAMYLIFCTYFIVMKCLFLANLVNDNDEQIIN